MLNSLITNEELPLTTLPFGRFMKLFSGVVDGLSFSQVLFRRILRCTIESFRRHLYNALIQCSKWPP